MNPPPLPDPKRKPKVEGFAKTRVEEPMGRGVVALATDDGGVYVGWRLLKEDPKSVSFDVYRQTGAESPEKLNDGPIRKTTDFLDENPVAGARSKYSVVPVVDGRDGEPSKAVEATSSSDRSLSQSSFRAILVECPAWSIV